MFGGSFGAAAGAGEGAGGGAEFSWAESRGTSKSSSEQRRRAGNFMTLLLVRRAGAASAHSPKPDNRGARGRDGFAAPERAGWAQSYAVARRSSTRAKPS